MTNKNKKTILGSLVVGIMLILMCACANEHVRFKEIAIPFEPIPGPSGEKGEQGDDGESGFNAVIDVILSSSCENGGYTLLTATDSNENNIVDPLDTNYKATQVCNGIDGEDGETQIAAILNPCGTNGAHDEVLIKIQTGSDIKVLASFSNNVSGDYTRFAVLTPGVLYATTDFSGSCKFRVDVSGNLYDEYL